MRSKRFWQLVSTSWSAKHYWARFAALTLLLIAHRETGAYEMRTPRDISPVSYDEGVDQSVVDADTAYAAVDFVKRFAQEQMCHSDNWCPQSRQKSQKRARLQRAWALSW